MDILFFGVFFVAFLFFIWAGRQFNNSTFLIVGGILSILLAFFVFGSGLTYSVPANQSMSFSGDYYKFFDDNVTCINCSNASCYDVAGGCSGELNCALLLDETNCTACDQCYWFEGECYEEQGAECSLSETCEDCPECEATEDQNATAFAPYCCEHDYNLTAGGSVFTSVEYKEFALTEAEETALALFFALVGLYILIVELSGVIGSKGYNRQYGLDG